MGYQLEASPVYIQDSSAHARICIHALSWIRTHSSTVLANKTHALACMGIVDAK
jgi:hypothetical protein